MENSVCHNKIASVRDTYAPTGRSSNILYTEGPSILGIILLLTENTDTKTTIKRQTSFKVMSNF